MLPAIGSALSIGSQAGNLLPAATSALGAGAAGAGASMSFMQALLGTPKGIAALGQGIGMLGKAAGMMIGGKKGENIAKSAGMFGLVAGLAPSISGAVKSFSEPPTGTPLDTNTAESGGGIFDYSPESKGLLQPGGKTNLGYMGILGNTFT